MSDALTDIRKDSELSQLWGRIHQKEKEFFEGPDKEKAAELQKLWANYYYSGSGYWSSPNRGKALERIALYEKYLTENCMDPKPLLVDQDPGENVFNIRIGAGFIVNSGEIESYIMRKIYERRDGIPVYYSNFRIKISVEEVERVSCAECPDFGDCIGTCNSRNENEYRQRRERREKGKIILNRRVTW